MGKDIDRIKVVLAEQNLIAYKQRLIADVVTGQIKVD